MHEADFYFFKGASHDLTPFTPSGKLTVTPEGGVSALSRRSAAGGGAFASVALRLRTLRELGADGAARRQAGIGSPPEPGGSCAASPPRLSAQSWRSSGRRGAPAREPEPAPSHDASDVIWRGDAGTELVAEINGRRYIALPAKLRRPSHCSRNIGGQEYVIFPAPSCKNGDNSV